jgi:hypothetical protein
VRVLRYNTPCLSVAEGKNTTLQPYKAPWRVKMPRFNKTDGWGHGPYMIFWPHLPSNIMILFFEKKKMVCW